jgi:hypothetical protein
MICGMAQRACSSAPVSIHGSPRNCCHTHQSKTTMEICSHVGAAQQREAVDVLQRALAAESHAESHATPDSGGEEWARTGQTERDSGSGGRVPAGY